MRSRPAPGPRRLLILALLAGAVACGCSATPAAPGGPGQAPAGGVSVVADATLPRIALSRVLPGGPGLAAGTALDGPGDPAVDHGIALGGVGSDIYPAQDPNEYWMVTDRGPNGQVKVDGTNRRTFPVPGFDPLLLRVRVDGAALRVLQVLPLTTTDGRPVTGLSNLPDRDEEPYDQTARTELPFTPSGLDTEGLVRAPNGEFWLSEEYSPSILRVSPTGTVLGRWVPGGLALTGAGYPVSDTLPRVLADRQDNRGFESLAISPDGRTLYAALQSPLALPDGDTGEKSRAVRVLALDTATGRPSAEYLYRMEDVAGFDPGAEGDQSEMKISAMAWYGPDELVVDERTDEVSRLYTARLAGATNLLGGEFDDPAHAPSLEQADQPPVTPLTKALLVDLTRDVPNLPTKLEGLAVRDPRTVAVANDNDFGMRDGDQAFDSDGRQRDTGVPSRLLVLRLPPR